MKQENTKIKWLRISYWTGAIADLAAGGAMVFFPGLTQHLWGEYIPIQETGFIGWKFAGSMIIAWTFLLLWADRKPLERKGTLLLTCFPVIVSLMAVEVYAMVQNIAPMLNLGIIIGMQSMLLILFSFSYFNSEEIE